MNDKFEWLMGFFVTSAGISLLVLSFCVVYSVINNVSIIKNNNATSVIKLKG